MNKQTLLNKLREISIIRDGNRAFEKLSSALIEAKKAGGETSQDAESVLVNAVNKLAIEFASGNIGKDVLLDDTKVIASNMIESKLFEPHTQCTGCRGTGNCGRCLYYERGRCESCGDSGTCNFCWGDGWVLG